MKLRVGRWTAALMAASGCARLSPESLELGTLAQEWESRTLAAAAPEATPALAVSPGAAGQLWTLDDLTALALRNNPRYRLVLREAETARAAARVAAEPPDPAISVSAGYNTTVSDPSPWIVGAGVSVPIETGGRRSHRADAARWRAEAAAKRAAAEALDMRAAVRAAALALGEAREVRRLAEERAAALDARTGLLAKQRAAGELAAEDLIASRVEANRARLEARAAATAERTAVNRLAETLGLPAAALGNLNLATDSLAGTVEPDDLPSARRAAMTGRADLLAALDEYAAAHAALLEAAAARMPSLAIGPAYEYDQDENKWSLSLSADLPLFGRSRAAVAEAAARCEEAAARVRLLQARVAAEVDAAFAEHEEARRQCAAAEALAESAARRLTVGEALAAAGEMAPAELAALRAELLAIRIEEVRAQWRRRAAQGRLEDVLQMISVPPPERSEHASPEVSPR